MGSTRPRRLRLVVELDISTLCVVDVLVEGLELGQDGCVACLHKSCTHVSIFEIVFADLGQSRVCAPLQCTTAA